MKLLATIQGVVTQPSDQALIDNVGCVVFDFLYDMVFQIRPYGLATFINLSYAASWVGSFVSHKPEVGFAMLPSVITVSLGSYCMQEIDNFSLVFHFIITEITRSQYYQSLESNFVWGKY